MKQPLSSWGNLISASSGDIRRLSDVWRYSSIPISCPENVADHSYWVALYSSMIHRTMHPDNSMELMGIIVLKALIHDMAECVTGDVVRTFKYSSRKLKEAIDEGEKLLEDKLPHEVLSIRELVEFFEKHTDPAYGDYVNSVVKAADFLSLYQFMRREALRGNVGIIPFYMRMIEDLKSMSSLKTISINQRTLDEEFPGAFYKTLEKEADGLAEWVFGNLVFNRNINNTKIL